MNKNFLLLIPIIMVMAGCEYSQFAQPEEPTAEHEHAFRLVPKQMNEQGAYKTSGEESSPYSCLLSTLADDEADYNYWNQSFWVHFPQEAIGQAGGEMVFKAFAFSSEHAGEKAGSWFGQENIVRVAQCVIPDSELAETLLEEQLHKFGQNTWLESRKEETQGKLMADEGIEAASGEWVCTELYTINVCQYNSATNTYYNCVELGPFCAEYVYEEGGVGGGGSGDDPGECDPQGTEPCYDGPGGSIPPPPEPDPCDESNPPAWCENKCETGNDILDDFGIQESFETLWKAQDATNKEQGAFIYPSSTGNGYVFNKLADHLIVEQEFDKIAFNVPSNLPSGTTFVHTHPEQQTRTLFGITFEYRHRPSRYDYESIEKMEIETGIILSQNEIIIFDSVKVLDRINRCGY